jgi:sulfite dehydrogenase (cytochrome) subunit B
MRTCSLLALSACVALVTAHYSPTLAAQRDHGGFRALPKIQSHAYGRASIHRGKGRRRSGHHRHAKHVKAALALVASTHRGFRTLPEIQSHADHRATINRGKGRRRSGHHRQAKHVKAALALVASTHRGFRTLPEIQSHADHRATINRGKGRRRSGHHRQAKHVKAGPAHYVPTLAAQDLDHGLVALTKIHSYPGRHASTHRGKARGRWYSDPHHHAKHIRAGLTLAAQRDHAGFRALPKIQSRPERHVGTHRAKGGRPWHSKYHHDAKHVKAGLTLAASTHRGKSQRHWHSGHYHHAKFKAVALSQRAIKRRLAAQRDHRRFRALRKIQSHAHGYASSHRGKDRRGWHSDYHHHRQYVKAVLKTPYGGQHSNEVKEQKDVAQEQVFATRATGPEKAFRLREAPGRDKVEAHCSACHSLDYVIMNSSFLNASSWDAEVAKMINAFGAPIDQSDAEIIADYLKKNYGM